MRETKIGTGTDVLDWLLECGYDRDVLTCIYGPPGTGKTNALLVALAHSDELSEKKVIYIDTEGNFSLSRFKQLTDDHEAILDRTVFLRPTTFEEQRKAFDKLRKIVTEKVGAIFLDGAAMLYRLELGKTKDVYNVNRELGLQLSFLTEIARKKRIPILVTNQVYEDLDSGRVKMVGGDILRYASKCLLELRKAEGREAILRKHRSLPEKSVAFRITDRGMEYAEED